MPLTQTLHQGRKVWFVTAAPEPWGAEHSLRLIAGEVRKRGWEVTIVCRSLSVAEFFGEFEVRMIGGVAQRPSRPRSLAEFWRALRTASPEVTVIIFSLDLLPIAWLFRLMRRNSRPRLIADLHDYPGKRITRWVARLFLRSYDEAIYISKFMAPFTLGARKSTLVPRPIVAVPASTRAVVPLGDARLRVGIVGRLDPEKNIEVAIDAIRIASTQVSVILKIYGATYSDDDEYVQSLRAAALEGLKADQIIFEGQRPPSEIYPNIDVLMIANEREPSGRTAGEAQASGVVALVPDSGGAREYVVDGVSGLCYAALDPVDAARALIALGRDRRLLAQLAQGGLESVRSRDVETVGAEYSDVVRRSAAT